MEQKRKKAGLTRTRAVQICILVLCFALLFYLILSLMFYFLQDDILYKRSSEAGSDPSDIGLEFEELWLTTQDGETLHAWYVPAEKAGVTVLFCHGNNADLGGMLGHVRVFNQRCGFNALVFDYRGFGRTTGEPTEFGTYLDVQCCWKFLTQDMNVPPESIVIYGQSMGGPIAAWRARESKGELALVLESTYASYRDEADDIVPFLPMDSLARFDYPTAEYASECGSPVLIIHSRDDETIGYHHGERIFRAAKEPKEMLTISGSHGTCVYESEDDYAFGLSAFIEKWYL